MAFKFIVLFGFLAAANAGDLSGGYVSYAPTVAKTIQYAEPLKTVQYAAVPVQYATAPLHYAAPVAKTIEYAEPVHKTIEYAAPVTKTIQYAAPIAKTLYQPTPVIQSYAKAVVDPEYHSYTPSTYATSAYTAPSAYASAAYAPAAYAPTAYAAHGTVSHHGKTIATPHSYVSKYDTRYVHEDPHYYPTATVVKTPAIVKTPIVAAPVVPTVYKSPVVPVVKSYDSYDHSYAHATPVIAKTAVSYSPAVAVSHATFESAHGQYAW